MMEKNQVSDQINVTIRRRFLRIVIKGLLIDNLKAEDITQGTTGLCIYTRGTATSVKLLQGLS